MSKYGYYYYCMDQFGMEKSSLIHSNIDRFNIVNPIITALKNLCKDVVKSEGNNEVEEFIKFLQKDSTDQDDIAKGNIERSIVNDCYEKFLKIRNEEGKFNNFLSGNGIEAFDQSEAVTLPAIIFDRGREDDELPSLIEDADCNVEIEEVDEEEGEENEHDDGVLADEVTKLLLEYADKGRVEDEGDEEEGSEGEIALAVRTIDSYKGQQDVDYIVKINKLISDVNNIVSPVEGFLEKYNPTSADMSYSIGECSIPENISHKGPQQYLSPLVEALKEKLKKKVYDPLNEELNEFNDIITDNGYKGLISKNVKINMDIIYKINHYDKKEKDDIFKRSIGYINFYKTAISSVIDQYIKINKDILHMQGESESESGSGTYTPSYIEDIKQNNDRLVKLKGTINNDLGNVLNLISDTANFDSHGSEIYRKLLFIIKNNFEKGEYGKGLIDGITDIFIDDIKLNRYYSEEGTVNIKINDIFNRCKIYSLSCFYVNLVSYTLQYIEIMSELSNQNRRDIHKHITEMGTFKDRSYGIDELFTWIDGGEMVTKYSEVVNYLIPKINSKRPEIYTKLGFSESDPEKSREIYNKLGFPESDPEIIKISSTAHHYFTIFKEFIHRYREVYELATELRKVKKELHNMESDRRYDRRSNELQDSEYYSESLNKVELNRTITNKRKDAADLEVKLKKDLPSASNLGSYGRIIDLFKDYEKELKITLIKVWYLSGAGGWGDEDDSSEDDVPRRSKEVLSTIINSVTRTKTLSKKSEEGDVVRLRDNFAIGGEPIKIPAIISNRIEVLRTDLQSHYNKLNSIISEIIKIIDKSQMQMQMGGGKWGEKLSSLTSPRRIWSRRKHSYTTDEDKLKNYCYIGIKDTQTKNALKEALKIAKNTQTSYLEEDFIKESRDYKEEDLDKFYSDVFKNDRIKKILIDCEKNWNSSRTININGLYNVIKALLSSRASLDTDSMSDKEWHAKQLFSLKNELKAMSNDSGRRTQKANLKALCEIVISSPIALLSLIKPDSTEPLGLVNKLMHRHIKYSAPGSGVISSWKAIKGVAGVLGTSESTNRGIIKRIKGIFSKRQSSHVKNPSIERDVDHTEPGEIYIRWSIQQAQFANSLETLKKYARENQGTMGGKLFELITHFINEVNNWKECMDRIRQHPYLLEGKVKLLEAITGSESILETIINEIKKHLSVGAIRSEFLNAVNIDYKQLVYLSKKIIISNFGPGHPPTGDPHVVLLQPSVVSPNSLARPIPENTSTQPPPVTKKRRPQPQEQTSAAVKDELTTLTKDAQDYILFMRKIKTKGSAHRILFDIFKKGWTSSEPSISRQGIIDIFSKALTTLHANDLKELDGRRDDILDQVIKHINILVEDEDDEDDEYVEYDETYLKEQYIHSVNELLKKSKELIDRNDKLQLEGNKIGEHIGDSMKVVNKKLKGSTDDLEKRLFRAKLQYEQIERDGKREGENDEEFEMRKFDARRTYEKLQKEYDNKNKDVTNPRGSRIEPEDSDDSTGPVSPEPVSPEPVSPTNVSFRRGPDDIRQIPPHTEDEGELTKVLNSKEHTTFKKLDKDLKSFIDFHFPKIQDEFKKLKKRERIFGYQRKVNNEIKTYRDDILKLITDLMWLKGNVQSNYDDTQEIFLNHDNTITGGSQSSRKDPFNILKKNMKETDKLKKQIDEMVFELENIVLKLNNRYNIGKGSKSKEIRYYEDILKRFKGIFDFESSEYINACKQIKRLNPYNKELSGHDNISKGIEEAQKKCKIIAKKQKDIDKTKKEREVEDKNNKMKHEKELKLMKKQLESAQKQVQKTQKVQGSNNQIITKPTVQPGQPGQPGQPEEPKKPQQPGEPGQPGIPVDSDGKLPINKKEVIPVSGEPGKKSMDLNMGENIDEKLLNINKKQGQDLIVPPKEKLEELSRVMKSDKIMDIIRNKTFSEFTEKEIKDVDIVRDRFNSFVNDYYELLDIFYKYKKNKENGQKEDIILLLKQEKQIESLKDIVLEYKTNLENFRLACENTVKEKMIQKDKEIKEKEKEFTEVFQYMQELFKSELKEEKNATKKNTLILKQENKLQEEKILLLKKKKLQKKRTPIKKRDRSDKKKPKSRDKTPRKPRNKTTQKGKDKGPKKSKRDRTPKKGKGNE